MRLTIAAAALIAVSPAAAASAKVRITPAKITLAGKGAGATITRNPFSISFTNGRGHRVLSGLQGSAGASQSVAGLPRVQFGTQGPPPATLYRPFAFLVGSHSISQFPASQWQGNLTSVTESGTEYGAVAVQAAQRSGKGVRLTLTTSDPSGRRVIATVVPGPSGAISVSAIPSPASGVAAMSDSFRAGSGEAFRGFGGRHNRLDQRGTEFYNYTQQENISSGAADSLIGVTNGPDYLFPNGPHSAYYVQSSFQSSHGYGFLLDRNEISHWRMASDRSDAWQVQAAARRLDYTVTPGSPRAALRTLTGITGRHKVPPRWALGPIIDREVIFQNDSPSKYEGEVRQDLADFKRYGVHPVAYRIEGWQFLPRPVLRELIAKLRAMRIRPMVYFRGFVGQDQIGTDSPAAYDEALAKGYVATRANGDPYTFSSNFSASGAQIDFTNPAAVRWWQGRIREALNLGADGFMEDFGEQVVDDMHFHDGSTGAVMHNRLPVLFHRATDQVVRAFEKSHPKRKIFYFNRAGYSGSPGSAAYEFANFPGDETTDFTRSAGLASQTPDMLNRGIGGAYGYTTDIGGFFDVGPYTATTEELFIRWAEWAALSPMFRLHGSVASGVHMPWIYGPRTLAIYKRLARLHIQASGLILRLWRKAHRTGVPIARPLWLEYPGDEAAAKQDQEWMLGRDVLVAPVVTHGATTRTVYFPAGCWRSIRKRIYRGPRTVTVAAPLERLPYFSRCGTHPFRRHAHHNHPAHGHN